MLFERTQVLIQRLEKRLKGRVLGYWTTGNGSVCQSDVVAFYELLQSMGPQPHLYLFIKSNGGNGQAALRIINLLRQYAGKLTALVPLQCASAATMMALGADQICMGPLAYLTAIDTSLTHDLSPVDKNNHSVSVSQDELVRVLKLWRDSRQPTDGNPYQALYPYIHPLVFGAIDRASSLSIQLCTQILRYHITDDARAQAISTHLNSHYPSHNYPITLREAKRTGLNVAALDDDVNGMLLELNELYSEMGQKALTDFDVENYHNNEILNILECRGAQVFYQNDEDWHYLKDERRWLSMHDQSCWHKVTTQDGKRVQTRLHIR